jgi:acetylornithine/succinyldiaminopimelate/putrescine aminotransferase/predicted amino acid dehydrogenase
MQLQSFGSTEATAADTALNPQRHFLLQHIGFDKVISRTEGHYLIDQQGNRYLDALAQYGAVPFGHNPAFLWDALLQLRATGQPGFVQPLLNSGAETLARKLVSMLPGMAHVCFVSTGAEATEVAIKLARARTGRRKILTVDRGFHGKTNAALCATANPRYRAPFLVDREHFLTLPFGDLQALEQALKQLDTAAFIIESVQGEGGMRVQPAGYLLAAQELCKRYGALLVLDEVQTGFGRTGSMFGLQRHGELRPDVVLLAKALGGGLVPLGAVVCTADAWTDDFGMFHSSTFANSHLTTTLGLAVIEALEANEGSLLRQIERRGELLRAGLEQLAQRYPTVIAAIYGQGLMHGIELRPWSGASSYFNAHASQAGYAVPIVAGYLLNRQKVLTAPTFNTSNVLRVQPSLTITETEIATILRALEAAMALIANEDFAELFSAMVPTVPSSTESARSERRPKLWPVASRTSAGKPRRFAFLMHPTDDQALFNILPEAIKEQGEAAKAPWVRWLNSWTSRMRETVPVFHVENFQSRTGATAEGWLIATPMTPSQMIRMGAEAREHLMASYVAEARKLDVDIVGLGAFTSVISQGGTSIANCGLNLTTGNSLTAMASAESLLHQAALEHRVDEESFAVVGAAGSVGRLAAFHLAHRGAGRLYLVGNASNQKARAALKAVAGEILISIAQQPGSQSHMAETLRRVGAVSSARWCVRPTSEAEYAALYDEVVTRCTMHSIPCPIVVTTDVAEGVRNARFVITATSAGRSFITPDVFMQGAVVCDVARPLDVANRMAGVRDDLGVYEGGLMHLPDNVRFGDLNVLGYPDGINLACLSETIVLALDGATGHHSLGNRIDYTQAVRIHQTAHKHGFNALLEPYVAATAVQEDTSPRVAAIP